MKLYEQWLSDKISQNLDVNKLTAMKMSLQNRANLIRRKMAGKVKISQHVSHELNVIQAKINKIDRILSKYTQNRYL